MDKRPGAMLSVHEDIAFLRSIAEEGRRVALQGGLYLILWGALICGAYLNHHFAISRSPPAFGLVAIGYVVMILLGWGGVALLVHLGRGRGGVRTVVTRIFTIVFVCAGGILTVFSACVMVSGRIDPALIGVVAAQLMGLCFFVSGQIASERWLIGCGALWLAASVGLAFLIGTSDFYLVSALIWAVLLVGPGIGLEIRRRGAPPDAKSPRGELGPTH